MARATVGCLVLALCTGLLLTAPAGAQDNRVSGSEKGSLLIYPKVEVRWDAEGKLIQDTFVDLTNDYPGGVAVQMYFINGDPPLAAEDGAFRPSGGAGQGGPLPPPRTWNPLPVLVAEGPVAQASAGDLEGDGETAPPGTIGEEPSSSASEGVFAEALGIGPPMLQVTLVDGVGTDVTDAVLAYSLNTGFSGKAYANADGVYEIPDLGSTKLSLETMRPDGHTARAEVTIPSHAANEPVYIEVAVDAQPAALRLKVGTGGGAPPVTPSAPLPVQPPLGTTMARPPTGGSMQTATCDVSCDTNGLDEPEACGADVNGGCNSDPPAFTDAECGDTWCGTAWAYNGVRDTDWYLVTLGAPTTISATLTSEFPGVVFIVDGIAGCDPVVVGQAGYSNNCVPGTASATVLAGTYVVFVATGNESGGIYDGIPCTAGINDYTVSIDCGQAGGCGDPAAGSCCESHPTPYCDDEDCCETVCEVDYLCCDEWWYWDGICVAEAEELCGDLCTNGGPANDHCEDAIGPLGVPSITPGSTVGADVDPAPYCDVAVTSPGVWYTVIGTGGTMTASLCNEGTDYDSKLTVYCGSCDDMPGLTCVAGNDDYCGLQSEVSWCSQYGAEYLILVHGFGGASGTFKLEIPGDHVFCEYPVPCVPVGACCVDLSCGVETEPYCLTLGGKYLGDGTNCDAVAGTPLTYSANPNWIIGDNDPAGTAHTINVPAAFSIGDLNVGVGITHTWVGDLCVTLSHAGTEVTLIARMGNPVIPCELGYCCGCSANNLNIILDDEGTGGPIEDVCVDNPSSLVYYLPEEALAAFDGLTSAGPWTLRVTDYFPGDTGTLNSWKLIIDPVGPHPCGEPERAHPGCNWVDVGINLTANQPTFWSAASGLPAGVSPWTILDPGTPPGRPDPDGSDERVLRGYIVAYAVGSDGEEINWNHLKGDALIVNYAGGEAWEYNAWAFQALAGTHGQPTGTPGEFNLNGIEYDKCFSYLMLDFMAAGSTAFSPAWYPGGIVADTDLTLFPVDLDVRQDGNGPVTTKAKFDVWNGNEVKLTGMTRCITCWDQALISRYEAPNHFLRVNLQTDKGKARIEGVASSTCSGSVSSALLGVAAKMLDYGGGAFTTLAGTNLVGMGTKDAVIRADVTSSPPPTNPGRTLDPGAGVGRGGR